MATRCVAAIVCLVLPVDALVLFGNGHALPASSFAARRIPTQFNMLAKKVATKKLVTVLLEKDVDGLGEARTVVEVKPAYAENVLVKKGWASIATKATLEEIEKEQAAAAAAAAAARKRAEDAKATLQAKFSKGLLLEVQLTPEGELKDGPITSKMVAADLARAVKPFEVDEESIAMESIEALGSAAASVTLHPEVSMSLKVTVQKSKITFS